MKGDVKGKKWEKKGGGFRQKEETDCKGRSIKELLWLLQILYLESG